MACPKAEGCALYELFTSRALLGVWKTYYCLGQHENCERFKRSETG
jgi:quinol monooxygenase YgiN